MDSKLYRNSFFTNNSLILVIAAIFLISACLLNTKTKKPPITLSKQETALNINTILLSVISAGHKRLITDLLWIQTLIESDTDHYKKNDLNSWLFLRFNTISFLDPEFYQNYLYGGLYLSVIKDDVLGAAEILEKGTRQFPNDYQLNFNLGFNYYFEMGDFNKGLKALEKIQDSPQAPPYIKLIVGKLKFETSHNFEAAIEFLKVQIESTQDLKLKSKLKANLYALNAEQDLKCLNDGKQDCNKFDVEGSPYKKEAGTWKASRLFLPYRIHKPKQ